MIAIAITDRLGNQMFQYAAARGIAAKNNTIVKIDKRYYNSYKTPRGFVYGLDAFNIRQNLITQNEIREYTGLSDRLIHKLIRRVYRKHQKNNPNYMYYEKFFHYDETVFQSGDKLYLRGYWQSYKYFEHIKDDIKKEFSFKTIINRNDDFFAKKIMESNAVCISVRRGKDLNDPVNSKKFGKSGMEYYNNAIEIIRSKQNDLSLFVFSDDIEWCEVNLKFDHPTIFVKHRFETPGVDYFLQLISLCKHFVIPVSTFPWWGAWLSENDNKIVIAPRIWLTDPNINTNDLFPPGWIRI